MELWIRSQDKEALIKVDKIFYWNTCPEMPNTGKHYLGNKEWVGNADYTKLGEYKTKERAIEVLDEIQYKINNYVADVCMARAIYVGESQEPTYVYEMPKE